MTAQDLIQRAKQAILAGDKPLASSLAQEALELTAGVDALLVMAGIRPQASWFSEQSFGTDPENLLPGRPCNGCRLAQRASASGPPRRPRLRAPECPHQRPRRAAPRGGHGLCCCAVFMAYATNLGPSIEAFSGRVLLQRRCSQQQIFWRWLSHTDRYGSKPPSSCRRSVPYLPRWNPQSLFYGAGGCRHT